MAAATLAYSRTNLFGWGGTFIWVGTITPSLDYATGGIAVDVPAIFGMRTIDYIINNQGAWSLEFDKATSKIKINTFTYDPTAVAAEQPTVANALEELDNATTTTNYGAIPVIVVGR